jgi:hypothetical protein
MKILLLCTLLAISAAGTGCQAADHLLTTPGAVEEIAPAAGGRPAVLFTNQNLAPGVTTAIKTADRVGSAAGFPWVHTVAEAVLGLATAFVSLRNLAHKKKLKDQAAQRPQSVERPG